MQHPFAPGPLSLLPPSRAVIGRARAWAATLLVGLLPLALVAAPPPVPGPGYLAPGQQLSASPHYRVTVLDPPRPEDYPHLSPEAFASLRPEPRRYPTMMPEWAHAPLVNERFFNLASPRFARDEHVALQLSLLHANNDLSLASAILQQLNYAASPAAVPGLRRYLEQARHPRVLADTLQALRHLGARPANPPAAWLSHDDHLVRWQAWQWRLSEPQAGMDLWRAGLAEPEPHVRRLILAAAARAADPPPPAWEALGDTVPPSDVEALAPLLLAWGRLPGQRDRLLALAERAGVPGQRALANALPADYPEALVSALLTPLARHAHSAVRQAVTATIGRHGYAGMEAALLGLARDPATEVRREAAQALGAFAHSEAAFEALTGLLGDPESLLTRQAAVASLTRIAGTFPVDARLDPAVTSDHADRRRHAAEVLVAIGSHRHAAELARWLPRETRPVNLVANLEALRVAGYHAARADIIARGRHEAPSVRVAAARAIGALQLEEGYDLLIALALPEREQEVRWAALEAMGWTMDARFTPTLLTIIQRTDYTGSGDHMEYLMESDRVAAAWALSRLPLPPVPVLTRLVALVRDKVVRTPLGPVFDGEIVRVSALYCLATLHRRHDEARPGELAWTLIRRMMVPDDATDIYRDGFVVGPELRTYTYQLVQWLEGEAIRPVALKPTPFIFNFRLFREDLEDPVASGVPDEEDQQRLTHEVIAPGDDAAPAEDAAPEEDAAPAPTSDEQP